MTSEEITQHLISKGVKPTANRIIVLRALREANRPMSLKALEMKQKLLLEDLNVVKDDSNAVNVTFMSMNKEDFESLDVVEINEGSNNSTELGADFGVADDDNNSFEARMKAEVQKKMENLEKK